MKILSIALVITSRFLTCEAFAADDVLARIGDTDVKIEEVRSAIENLDPREQAAVARDPALLNQAVRLLLVQRIVLKEAVAKQWDQQPGVASQLARLRENAIVESYLQSVSQPPANFPSTAEVESAYEANKAALQVPRQLRLAQVFISLPRSADQTATDAAQGRLETVRKALRARDADFAAIARTGSDDKESAGRGEIGWIAESRIQPEIRPKISVLAKSGISEPVRLDDGWHILKVLDIKEAHMATLDEVREQLAQQLRTQRMQANRQAYLGKLVQQNPVAMNELALSKVVPKVEPSIALPPEPSPTVKPSLR